MVDLLRMTRVANNGLAAACAPMRVRGWRGGSIVTIALTAAVLCLAHRLAAPAHAMSPMLQGWLAANTECRSGPDDPKTRQACKRRDQVSER
jgi:hypothetical protein